MRFLDPLVPAKGGLNNSIMVMIAIRVIRVIRVIMVGVTFGVIVGVILGVILGANYP